jgi:hypothetical protein
MSPVSDIPHTISSVKEVCWFNDYGCPRIGIRFNVAFM